MALEVPHLGHGSAMMVGQETVWGTAVARTNALRIVSWGLKRTISRVARPHLGTTSAVSMNRRQHYTETDEAGGSVEYLMSYDDTTVMLMMHGLGANVTAGTGPYTHTVTLGAFPYTVDTTKLALTLEGILGTSGEAEVFEGCLATRTEISLSQAGVMTCRQEFIAETSGGQTAASTPTFSSNGEEILHAHGGEITFNATTDPVREFSVTVDQKLARRHFLGSTTTQQPMPSDFIEVTGRFVIEYADDDRHDEFVLGTQGDATMSFTGTGNNALAITLQNLYITDVSESVNTAGVITQTVEFKCESDGTDEGLKLVFTNDNATATAN